MKRKGSLRRISPEMKQQISDYVFRSENTDKSRETMANEIEALLLKSGQRSPSLDTIKKMISTFRNKSNPLDMPWHLGTLKDYHLSEYAVNRIFLLKPFAEHREPVFNGGLQPWQVITIRDALWIAKLSALNMSLEWLWDCTQEYSRQERFAELAGTSFDSSDLDNDLADALVKHPNIFWLSNPKMAIVEMFQDKEFDAARKITTTKGYLRPVLEYLIKKEEAQNERTHS
jgi:hypothetical protein